MSGFKFAFRQHNCVAYALTLRHVVSLYNCYIEFCKLQEGSYDC
jgi:hypothetical protein